MRGRTGYTVVVTVDGQMHEFKEWRPHYVQGLAEGEHTFKLELLKAKKRLKETSTPPKEKSSSNLNLFL
jgi:hypothetical protein